MEKNRFLKIIIVCLLVLNFGVLAFLFFQHKPPGKHDHPRDEGGPAAFIIKELGFDENQVGQFNDLKSEHQDQMREIQDSMRIQRDMFPDLIVEGDAKKADSVSTEIGKLQKRIEYCTFEHFVKVRALCNDEQKKKFKNIIKDILHMMGPRKGPPR
jgi:hypothetical protein